MPVIQSLKDVLADADNVIQPHHEAAIREASDSYAELLEALKGMLKAPTGMSAVSVGKRMQAYRAAKDAIAKAGGSDMSERKLIILDVLYAVFVCFGILFIQAGLDGRLF